MQRLPWAPDKLQQAIWKCASSAADGAAAAAALLGIFGGPCRGVHMR